MALIRSIDVRCDWPGCVAWEHGAAGKCPKASEARQIARLNGFGRRGGMDVCSDHMRMFDNGRLPTADCDERLMLGTSSFGCELGRGHEGSHALHLPPGSYVSEEMTLGWILSGGCKANIEFYPPS